MKTYKSNHQIEYLRNPLLSLNEGLADQAENSNKSSDPVVSDLSLYEAFSYEATADVRKLHRQVPGYTQTPLIDLKNEASEAGVKAVLIKDESKRFGLKAFKGLGGVYAMYRMICEKTGAPDGITLEELHQEPYASMISDMTFITTTDGNHGKGVSWASGIFGCRSYVFMPKGTVEVRAQAIRDAGNAEVTITDMSYDACVKYCAKLADTNGWMLIQDTSWDGYEKVPMWIMQGYTTLVFEALDQMRDLGYRAPTHVFVQAGVGAIAGSVCGAFAALDDAQNNSEKTGLPVISIVEPTEVACIYESFKAGDGNPHRASGSEQTIMAGLNCAVPCTIAWDIIKNTAAFAFRCSDTVSEHGMKSYAEPAVINESQDLISDPDPEIISGESGAVTYGLLDIITKDPDYKEIRNVLGLNQDSVVLLINTEGDTDPENWRRITGNQLPAST